MGVVDDIINLSWDLTVKENWVVLGKVLVIITELETILGVRPLFNRDELEVLEHMLEKTPDLVVHKLEFKKFLLRLVNYDDFEIFLLKRFKLTSDDLVNISVKSKGANPAPEIKLETRTKNYNLYGDNSSEFDKLIEDNKYLKSQLHQKDLEINDLKNQLQIANDYSNQLETTIKQSSSSKIPTNSIENLKVIRQQNSIIELLEHQNSIYQQELQNFIEKDKRNEIKFNELVSKINQSSNLTNLIQNKLNLNEDHNSKFQRFLKNSPFIKQYYFFYNYKKQNNNWGMIIINSFTLLFTLIFVLNILQILWFFGLRMFKYISSLNQFQYIYDLYEPRWFDIPWWRSNNSIEAWLWELEDWFRI
jgi:hypothetical protein